MKRVLLTGGAGFIAAHTLEHILTNTDWFVVLVDSLEHKGDTRRINQVLSKDSSWESRISFFKKNLAMSLPIEEMNLWGPIDYVINMASESHVDRSIADPVPFVMNNIGLTLNMLEYARLAKPKVFIQISTDEVFGPTLKNDSSGWPEWSRLLPSNPYSASKASQEMLAITYWRTYGVPVIITNTMNNIGEMQDAEKFLPLVIKSILDKKTIPVHGSIDKNGKRAIGSRFYLHARNHSDALVFLLQKFGDAGPAMFTGDMRHPYPDRFNVVGDTHLSNLELVKKVAAIMRRPFKYEVNTFHESRPGHDLHYGLDGSKLKNLGWTPPFEFDFSLEQTVKNYLKHREWLGE